MLVNCAAYQNGRKLADIGFDQIASYLSRPECFVWVALADPDEKEFAAVRQHFQLHELAVEDAMKGHQRPKIDEYADGLFAVLHLPQIVDGELKTGEVDVFVGRNFILSLRNRCAQGFLGVRQRCEEEPHLLKQGPVFVLYALIDAVVSRYFPVIDALEREIESIEAEIFSRRSTRATIERLYELKYKVMMLRHATVPLGEAVGTLLGGRVPALVVNMQEYFRDIFDHLSRIDSMIEVLRDGISTAIQINLSLVAYDSGEVNKRLAGWAAIFACATLFAGIWGMNFKIMPELEWEYGYPFALTVIVSACGILFWRLRKAKWI